MNVIEIPEVQNFLTQLLQFLEIESVICYGSYATGYQDQKSDVDLLIFVKNIPEKRELEEIYHQFKGFHKIELKELDLWNSSWTMMNGSLEAMNGMKIEFGFNTIEWTKTVMQKLLENHEISFEEFPFRPYTFLGLLEHSQSIYDQNFFIEKLKSKIRPFPLELKKAIVKPNLAMLQDCLLDLEDNIARNIGILSYQFHIGMGLDAAIQLLWVLNDYYDPASKRSENYLFKLRILPENFEKFISITLPKCYEKREEFLQEFLKVKDFIEKQIIELKLT